MVLNDLEIRALRALRAPGGISAEQAWERWPAAGSKQLHDLVKKGFAAHDGETFTITEAGRAACPFRNPVLAAMASSKPEENPMSDLNGLTYKGVVAAIVAAGPAGMNRKQLADKFGAGTRNEKTRIDAHVFYVLKRNPPPIVKLAPGHYVAEEYLPVKAPKAPLPKAEAPAKADEFSLSIGAKPGDLPAVTEKTLAAVDSMLAALPPLGAGAVQRPRATVPDLVHIEDARLIEFAIFSTGGFEIHTENGTVRLGKGALDKLRRFLGMFAEAV